MPTLTICQIVARQHFNSLMQRKAIDRAREELDALANALEKSASAARSLSHRLATLADLAKAMFDGMEFGFLFDADRQLLSIGYRSADGSLDPNFYDLLASEARLASFVAIAKGDVPAKHWFRLGRTLTPIDGGSGLISWSGSMFEYLMPSLVMRAPAGSLLEQTNRLVVRRQEEYGDELGVPWGMSESEYNARDIEQTYQYSSFGVPDLGYKRGLSENIVIAPYASGLAAMIDPAAAARNFRRMAGIGARGAYGWYEALDYTRARLPEGAKFAIVRAYMAHHQAMTSSASPMRCMTAGCARAFMPSRSFRRPNFCCRSACRATSPWRGRRRNRPGRPRRSQASFPKSSAATHRPIRALPRTHLLSNGRYSTMVTAAGSGYSRWHDIAITRWREDVTCDGWGAYIFLRDVRSGEIWSAGYQPSVVEPDATK